MKLMILDGNSIVNRAFYGVRMLNAPDGTPSNAVYGFTAILQRLLEEQKPEAVCVAFDLKAPTFRHLEYDAYKAQRKPMPEELAVQIPILKELLDAMGIRRYELEGYEADDILGTAAAVCQREGWDCAIVTGDKDSLQLISAGTTVCNVKTRMGQTETINYTPALFREEYGFEPERMVDLKALMGDSSDNIPGVPGVGEKTALDLIRRYGTIDNIYAGLDSLDIKAGVRKKLREGEESARKSYWLATIARDIPIHFVPEENLWNRDYQPSLYPLMKRLGFNKFIEKWGLEPDSAPAGGAPAGMERIDAPDAGLLRRAIEKAERVAVLPVEGLDSLEICDGERVYTAAWNSLGEEYNPLLRLLFGPKTKKIGQNVKDLIGLLLKEGLPAEGFIFDTALAGYLLDATGSDYSPQRLSARWLGGEQSGAEALYHLCGVLDGKLKELKMDELYYSIELPLCRVLADMEQAGFFVDRKALYEFGESLNGDIARLQEAIWGHAGHEFNINSPKQLGEVLFDQLMLPSGKKTKTGWSTNADVLEKLRGKHPIIEQVLEFRMLAKLKSTYADGLLKVISPDGRIHTSFQMTVTATGRLSSTEPNLQNIPVRRALGAQIRKMFVAAPGMTLVDADYSQIELRLLAHISGDETMREAFLSGEDFHSVTASKVFNVPLSEVTPTLRSRAKAVNFGIVYGISAFSLAQDIGVWPSEAKTYMDAYMEKYHGVRDYMKNIVVQAREDGYVSTLFGRRRELPELKSSNFNMRSFGERVALNMPIQGTAADIIKLAMVNVQKRLSAEGMKSRLILQVHDELIVECPEGEADKAAEILRQEMENAVSLAVPLTVDVHAGHSWAEAH
ncbi:MAG: DNA polymerase I [Firmicutes bacterium]|nr:DNA polymerase I [Oscillospiraceae bacterium]MBS5433161.1 DNA polymerase I [Bacillota bacterium]